MQRIPVTNDSAPSYVHRPSLPPPATARGHSSASSRHRMPPRSVPHHETFSTTIQPPYSSTKGMRANYTRMPPRSAASAFCSPCMRARFGRTPVWPLARLGRSSMTPAPTGPRAALGRDRLPRGGGQGGGGHHAGDAAAGLSSCTRQPTATSARDQLTVGGCEAGVRARLGPDDEDDAEQNRSRFRYNL
jgi:hypothetical protein